jgi:hypothetical protein
VRVTYRKFDAATVSGQWFDLLTACRKHGWRGSLTGPRSGSRTYFMQKGLWLLYLAGKGAAAFNPDAPDPAHKRRHMRSNIKTLGPWSQAVDVSDPEGLIAAAAKLGVALHRPYNPPESWHVEAVKPFKFGGGAVVPAADRKLAALLKKHGVVYPLITIREARATKLPLAFACAMLEKESGGGENVFGHDGVKNPVKGGKVTKARYLLYKRYRKMGWGMQGVGPCQLTWFSIQDRADALGGCHLPGPNMRVGFATLGALIRAYGPQQGARRYNGVDEDAERYGRDFVLKAKKWQQIIQTGK